MATLLGSHFVVETEKSGAPYVVRPTRPRSYLDFEKKKAAARRHFRGLTRLGRARRASGAADKNDTFCTWRDFNKILCDVSTHSK